MFSSTPPLNSETKLKEEKEGIFLSWRRVLEAKTHYTEAVTRY